MLRIFRHGQVVMKAVKRGGDMVGRCAAVAYLLRRPPGKTFNGARHSGSFSFLVIDVKTLIEWDAKSNKAPRIILKIGDLVSTGRSNGEEGSRATTTLASRAGRVVPPQDR